MMGASANLDRGRMVSAMYDNCDPEHSGYTGGAIFAGRSCRTGKPRVAFGHTARARSSRVRA
jgi:hypothetical protein